MAYEAQKVLYLYCSLDLSGYLHVLLGIIWEMA